MFRLLLSLCLSLVVAAENAKLADPDLTKIKFFLWTRQNPDDYDTVELTQESLAKSHFDSTHPTVILAHGWNSHGDGFGAHLAEAYFEVGDYNVFAIEWGDLETWANYPQAAIRTRAVGEHSANLVKILSDVGAFQNIHVVGHSLGLMWQDFMAKKVQAMGLGTFERVTGLDPAEPFFDIAGPDERIDKTDAKFVDIIHTNSGMLWNGCLSIKKSVGHVDIYPAGGSHQPGCVEACIIPDIMCYNISIEDLIKGGCSHERSVSYYKESITARTGGEEFIGWNCPSWEDFQEGNCCGGEQVVMGEWIDTRAPEGKYFLQVREEHPFSMSEDGIFV
eukprot:TRINITY_DN6159_c0_g1_i4.p1 TRINITY_DN6159_c0_g1~~TRINITY_DN6159_c0_g1_i4.p1  ORF type:complete len:334 (-),score=111.40 TRINITY_DN6159_c0_g1_i4:39-1040(-)